MTEEDSCCHVVVGFVWFVADECCSFMVLGSSRTVVSLVSVSPTTTTTTTHQWGWWEMRFRSLLIVVVVVVVCGATKNIVATAQYEHCVEFVVVVVVVVVVGVVGVVTD